MYGNLCSLRTRSSANAYIVRINSVVGTAVDAALREYIPDCDEWTELCINEKLVQIIAKVSGRIFVGPEVSEDPEYLECATNYTLELFNAIRAIKEVRPWLKPILAPRLPEVRLLEERERKAIAYLRPIVEERMEAQKNDPNWQAPDDMLAWMMKRGEGKVSVAELAKYQLGLIMAAIHTTTMMITNTLYTLAVTPEYIQPLREEVRHVMAENDGMLTSRALQQMEKLDSYMKEVMRFYPPGISK